MMRSSLEVIARNAERTCFEGSHRDLSARDEPLARKACI
jgi:hypothetical protein